MRTRFPQVTWTVVTPGSDKMVKHVIMTQDPPVKGISGGSWCEGSLWGDACVNTKLNHCTHLMGQSKSSSRHPNPQCHRSKVVALDKSRSHHHAIRLRPVLGRQRKPLYATAGLFSLQLLLLYSRVKNTDQWKDLQRFQYIHLGSQCLFRYQIAIKFSRMPRAKNSSIAGIEELYLIIYSVLHYFNNIWFSILFNKSRVKPFIYFFLFISDLSFLLS